MREVQARVKTLAFGKTTQSRQQPDMTPGLLDFESTKTSRLKGMLELGGLLVEAQIRKWGDPKHKQQSCMSFRVVLLQVRGLKREVF